MQPDHRLSNNDLKSAIDHLVKSIEYLDTIEESMNKRIMSLAFFSDDFECSWNEVNKCRIYTEKIGYIDEILYPTLGVICDGKCMVDSLMGWKIGMTIPAYNSIIDCVRSAKSSIRFIVDELITWLDPEKEEQL